MKKIYPLYALLTLAVFCSGVYFAGAEYTTLVDPATFMIVFIPLLLILLSGWTPAEIIGAFRAGMRHSEATAGELKNALLFFENAEALMFKIAFASTLLGVIIMLSSKWKIEDFGYGLSVAVLSIMYALIAAFVVIIPFKTAVKKKLTPQ